jgi:hypothetical protein
VRRSCSTAGAGEEEPAAAEEGEGEKDGALPQVLPQEDPGPAARDLRARLRYVTPSYHGRAGRAGCGILQRTFAFSWRNFFGLAWFEGFGFSSGAALWELNYAAIFSALGSK